MWNHVRRCVRAGLAAAALGAMRLASIVAGAADDRPAAEGANGHPVRRPAGPA